MRWGGRLAWVARTLGVVTLIGGSSVIVLGLSRPLPDPQLMANIDNSCLQFSQDGGQVWGDVSVITLDESFTPVPGGEYMQGDFLARNRCAATASLQVYAGAWQVSEGGSGLWRADLGTATGDPVELTGPATEDDWGVLINQVAAPTNQSIPVKLYLGIPAGETMQNYSINPAWSLSLEQAEPATVPDAPSGLQVQPGSPTTDDRVTVTGTAEPGSTVDVIVDGQVRCTTTASIEDGTFSCDVGTLSRGKHQISATATNPVGTSAPASPITVTVRNAGPNGWGSLDDLFNWGSLGGLGSLGSLGSSDAGSGSGSAVGSEAGSTTGSIAAGSLGTLGSAAASSGASEAGPGAPGNDDSQAGGANTGGAGAGEATGTGAGASAPGAGGGASGGAGNAATTGSGQGGGGSPANTGHGTSGGAATGQGAAGVGQGGTPGTGGVGAPGTGGTGQSGTGGGAAGGGAAGGQAAGTAPGATTGGPAGGAANWQLSADTLGIGSAVPGQSTTRPLGSVDGLLQLGSSTIRAGQ